MSLWETYFTDIMAHEKITCPFCGGMVTVGSVCEYCGSVIQLSTPIFEKGLPKTERKTVSGEQYAEKISKYQTVGGYYNGKLAIVSIGRRFGLIDKKGDLVLNLDYDNIYCVDGTEGTGLFAVCRFGKGYALYNENGKFITDFQYSLIEGLGNRIGGLGSRTYNPKGLNYVCRENKWGLINSDGIEILPCVYHEARFITALFSKNGIEQYDKYIKVKNDKKYGVFDVEGHEIIPCIHSSIYAYGESQQYMVAGSQLYDIESRQEVLPHIYAICSHFSNTFPNIVVKKEGSKRGVYNINARIEVLPCIYDIVIISDNLIIGEIGGKRGVFTLTGEKILPCVYDEITIEHNWIKVGRKFNNGENWGLFKLTGEEIVPCRYDRIEPDGADKLKLYYGMDYIGANHFFTIKMDGDRIVEKGSPKVLNGWSVFWSVLCLLGAIFFISSFGFFYNKFVLCLILCLLAVPVGCIWNALAIRRYKI